MSKIDENFKRWLRGTTCNGFGRKSIFWTSEDNRFAIFKHEGHSEYTDRVSGVGYCPTYYCLYDMDNFHPGLFGKPNLLHIDGRWLKKHWDEVTEILKNYEN